MTHGSRQVAAVALVLWVVLVAGCGDGGTDVALSPKAEAGKATAIAVAKPVPEEPSLLEDPADSAGDARSYRPSGDIAADSGFRPDADGFAFENYGNDVEPVNLTPAQVQDIFGTQVCVRGTGRTCELSPLAQKWMEDQNEAMDGGHCMGFSVTALRMFAETVDPRDYGARRPIDIAIRDNTALQSLIAEDFTYQAFPTVAEQTVEGSPREVVNVLEEALNTGKERYTIGIYQADGGGGHAITPFAVEDRGGGRKRILVYDNNFPGIVRALDVDTRADTWRYVGGTNPKDLDELYEGDADTQSLALLPTSPGERVQPCPFCSGEATPDGQGFGRVLGEARQYNEISLTDLKQRHPHLVLEDAAGRRTGIVDGVLINEIPEVRIKRNLAVQNWEETVEPDFQTPVGLPLTIHVDGGRLAEPVKAGITITGPGLDVEVDAIRLAPGQQDTVTFPGDGAGLTYETDARATTSPDLYATIEDGDVTKDGAYYVVGTAALGFGAGSRVGFRIDRAAGTFTLDTTGTRPSAPSDGLDGKSLYVATLVRSDAAGDAEWLTEDPVPLEGGDVGEELVVDFRDAPAAGRPLPIRAGRPGAPPRTIRAAPQR